MVARFLVRSLHPSRRPSQDSGFTMVEILLAIVILGMLVAIALPDFTNYSSRRHDTPSERATIAAEMLAG